MELEPGVRIIETPGHSRGHISVVVDTPEGTAVIAGDSFPNARTVSGGRLSLIFWNEREAEESIRKIMGLSSIIYPGHDRPFRIEADGSTRYIGGVATLNVMAAFEETDMGVGVTIALEQVRQTWVHSEAEGR